MIQHQYNGIIFTFCHDKQQAIYNKHILVVEYQSLQKIRDELKLKEAAAIKVYYSILIQQHKIKLILYSKNDKNSNYSIKTLKS